MPQGAAFAAVLAKDNAERPATVLVSIDVGQNEKALADVMSRIVKLREDAGDKVEPVKFKDLTIQVITPKDKKDKDEPPTPPMVWTHSGSVFYFGADIDAVKDLISHSGGREDSLASTDNYVKATKKLGSDAQIVWYSDLGKLLQLLPKIAAQSKNPEAFQQAEPIIGLLGLNGLKAVAGTYMLNAGNFDSVTKTIVVAPAPLTGLLKAFSLPKVSLRPEPWVPASIATYQSFSWDLDNAYTALNDLANSVPARRAQRRRTIARRTQRRRAHQL